MNEAEGVWGYIVFFSPCVTPAVLCVQLQWETLSNHGSQSPFFLKKINNNLLFKYDTMAIMLEGGIITERSHLGFEKKNSIR